MKLPALAILTAALFAGCTDDPVKSFEKQVFAPCKRAMDREVPNDAKAVPTRDGAFVRRLSSPATLTFDVRKTDSLSAPFTATIVRTQMSYSQSRPTAAAADAVTDTELKAAGTTVVDVLTYEWRTDGPWKVVSYVQDGRPAALQGATNFGSTEDGPIPCMPGYKYDQ